MKTTQTVKTTPPHVHGAREWMSRFGQIVIGPAGSGKVVAPPAMCA